MNKAADHVLDEFGVDTTVYDKDELARENEELRTKVTELAAIERDLRLQLKEMRQ